MKRYCNDLDVKLVLSSFKIGNLFGVKDPVPDGLRSRVVYKFVCGGCNACYVGETCRNFSTFLHFEYGNCVFVLPVKLLSCFPDMSRA